MARFFIVTINYAPEPSGFAPHATALAEHLARRGHDVSVFTGFPFAPQWRRRDVDRGKLFSVERSGNVAIHRVTHYIPRRPSRAAQRAAMEASFGLTGFAAIVAAMVREGRPDAVLYIGAQPALAMLSRIVAALAGRPYFVRVTDLAARAALDVGIVGSRLSRLLDAFEFSAYSKAAGASVLCRSFEDELIRHRYPAERIRVDHNPIDLEQIRPVPRDPGFRARVGVPEDAFVVMHAGSMGRKQGLLNVISAATLTRDTLIYWLFVGDGEARTDLVGAARARGVEDRVRFVPFQRDEEMAAMFAAADVLLVNQLGAVKDTLIPGKLLTYMAAGRPVLAAVNPASQAAQLLRDADGGVLVAPENPEALADAARQLSAASRDSLAACGRRNRQYAEEHFDPRKILAAQEQFVLRHMAVPASNPVA